MHGLITSDGTGDEHPAIVRNGHVGNYLPIYGGFNQKKVTMPIDFSKILGMTTHELAKQLEQEAKMAKQYDNSMSAALFLNQDKRDEKDPKFRGSAEVDGVEYWASAWVNKIKQGDREGEQMISIKFTLKEEKRGGKPAGKPSRRNDDDDL